jgi:hypothetical protein
MSQTKPFFIPQKEFDLINQLNEELIDEIVGQSVDIYKIQRKIYMVNQQLNIMMLVLE